MSASNVDGYVREAVERGGVKKKDAERLGNLCKTMEKKSGRKMSETEFLGTKLRSQDSGERR